MKICYLADGNSIHTQRWCTYFVERGHEVHVISTRTPQIENVKFHKIGCTKFKLLSDFLSVFECKKLLKSIKPDLVHAHFVTDYGLLGALMDYHPFIVSAWGSDILIDAKKSKLWQYATKYVFKKADAITCTSRYLYNATLPYIPKNSTIKIIPFGIDLSMFKPSDNRRYHSVHTIGIVKRLGSIYGIDYLIESIPYILKEHKHIKVLIIGGGDQRPYYAMGKDIGVERVLKFIGAVPHSTIPKYLSKLDIFVMPSLSESFGVVALEAQAMEVPIVATNVGGIPEVVKEGETGLLVEPRNSKAIANAVIQLLDDAALRKQMGERGRKFVATHYDWRENARGMEKLYNEVAY